VTQQLSRARIDLELRGLGVANAGWTVVDSVHSPRD
jgi:hypothetical protein